MRPFDPRIRQQLTPARRPLLGVVAAGVGGSLLLITQAWVVTGLVVAVVESDPIGAWLVAVGAVFVLRAGLGWTSDWAAARAAATVGTALRRRVVATVLRRHGEGHPPASSSGELAVLATRGVSAAEPYLTRYVPAVVLASILPALTLVAIATQDLLSALIVVLTLPLVPVFGALVGLATRDRAQEQWREMASLSGHFVDVVRGLPTLVAFRRARAQSDRIASFTDRYRRASLATLRLAFASSAVLELVATLSVALVAVVVGVRLAEGHLSLSTALVVLLLAPEAYWPLRRMGAEFHAAAEGVATFEAVAALDEDGPDPADVVDAAAADAALVIADLTVVHPGRTVPALDGVGAVVPARGVTALTGPSGCGKSTLLAAVAGLVPLAGGSVTAGGRPVGGDAWRAQVAWLPQRPVFVSGTIADNLRVGTPDAPEARLWDALRRVALEERVLALPRGLDEPVGEDGTTLSAGERARLALARVLVDDRPWVLLDEPTAHLDEVTEVIIADTIAELGRTGAVLVVAHRPALVGLADVVVSLPAPAPVVAPEHRAPAPARRTPAAAEAAAGEEPEPSSRRALAASTALGGLASAAGVALTATAGWLIVQASTQPPVLTLLVAIVGVRLFGLARPVLRYAERVRSHDVALRLLAERRVRVYDAVVPLVPGRLGRRRGDVLTSIVDDVDSVVDRELRVRLPVRGFVLVAVLAALVSALLLPRAGVLVLGTCLVSAALGLGLARAGAGRAERRAVERRADLSATVLEVLSIAPELVMWRAGDRAAERVAAASRRLASSAVVAARWLGGARAAVLVVHGLGVLAMAALAAPAVADGTLSGPRAALLVLVPLALGEVAAQLPDAGALSARTDAAAVRLESLERRAPAVRDTVPGPAPVGTDLELSHVSAGWDRGQRALVDLSLRVPPGSRFGLVGESGSGKSTVAALLLRFLDPARGAVLLGGRDLYRVALDDVRSRIGLVDDDPHVFASTLVENVRLARPSATDAEVEAALRRARLGPWLDSLPDGLDSWIGEGHAAVSGGERARIAVARSLLAEQPVLVLDEPTAHLDHATAEELAREVLLSPDDRTVVWITHDPVGLDLVDRVVELAGPSRVVPLVRR